MKRANYNKDRVTVKPQFVSKRRSRDNKISVNTEYNKRSFKSNECDSSDTDNDFSRLVNTVRSNKCKFLSAFSSSDSENDVVSGKKKKSVEDISRGYVDLEDASDKESNLSDSELKDENEV